MPLTIVMYHYVRDLSRSRFPQIKGLTVERFRAQLDHLSRETTFVKIADVVAAAREQRNDLLPSNAVLLTFDDGYVDHYTNVFPLLHERGIQGCFFPPAAPVLEGRVLDVNKVHFTLASVPQTQLLVDAINAAVLQHQREFNLDSAQQYWAAHATANRFDPAEVIYVKRMLQVALPEGLRNRICGELFRKFVSQDERAFASELYMTTDQLRAMIRCGMYVGAHGYEHYWMDRLATARQANEVSRSLKFLQLLGAPIRDWVMCYPYGAHNESLETLLAENGCALGLTTRVAIADLRRDHPLRLPRLDTNDLPAT